MKCFDVFNPFDVPTPNDLLDPFDVPTLHDLTPLMFYSRCFPKSLFPVQPFSSSEVPSPFPFPPLKYHSLCSFPPPRPQPISSALKISASQILPSLVGCMFDHVPNPPTGYQPMIGYQPLISDLPCNTQCSSNNSRATNQKAFAERLLHCVIVAGERSTSLSTPWSPASCLTSVLPVRAAPFR
jgi:hypothetical protein